MRAIGRLFLALPLLVIAGALWDAHRSDVAIVDVFFGAGGGMLLGTVLMLRQWAAELDRRDAWSEADQDSAYKEGVRDERERIADLARDWKPYAGVWDARDMANYIRRGDP